jgi:RNA polymerase sigma-70 factor (ECF subfamily)
MNSQKRKSSQRKSSQRWPETQWSIVLNAQDDAEENRNRAIAKLIETYLPALQAHLVIRKGLKHEAADDFLQEFFLKKIVEQNIVERADYNKGKFRSFILKSLENFLRDYFRSKQYRQRDVELPEDLPPEDESIPSADIFDKTWAFRVFYQAVELFQKSCEQSNHQKQWLVYRERMLRPVFHREPPCSYEELAEKLDDITPNQARNLLTKAKRNFAKSLRVVIREYVEDEAHVEDEINQLLMVLKNSDKLDDALSPFLAGQDVFDTDGAQLQTHYASYVFREEEDEGEYSIGELRKAWDEILSSRPFELFSEIELADSEFEPDTRIIEVMFHTEPSINSIDRIRRFAKTKHAETEHQKDSFPCYFALYLVCIAVGVYKCDRLLSQLDPKKLVRNIDLVIGYPWLDKKSIELLTIAKKLI